MLPDFMRLAVRSSTVQGQMLPVIYTVGCAILYCATPPYTTVRADAARFIRLAVRSSIVLRPLHST